MKAIIEAAFQRKRAVLFIFLFLLIAGSQAYRTIPKESEPDITIPIVYVSMRLEGISPNDAERLLLKPMEKELKTIEGLKEIRSVARQGYGSVTLEFDAGFDPDKALDDVREKVDIAKSELPPETDEPTVKEINVALFPVLAVALSGTLTEKQLLYIAKQLKDKIDVLPGVLDVKISGEREEMLEIVVDSEALESYHISLNDITNVLQRNNRLVAAGSMQTQHGRTPVKVPGVIESIKDVNRLPVKVVGKTVVTFGDVAKLRRNFKEPKEFARVGGKPALVLEVTKRVGANIIHLSDSIRQIIAKEKSNWPSALRVDYLQDKSSRIINMLKELQNNVIAAIVLVMIVVLASLGPRAAILVGLAIPGSFLTSILVIDSFGFTMNMVILFSLILVVGLLVDGAIVTSELGNRKLQSGLDSMTAFKEASKRMAWPIISSTVTTIVVFLPLLFWPGIVGEFMKYLPITVIITLMASILMALIFIPVLGGVLGRSRKATSVSEGTPNVDLSQWNPAKRAYLTFLNKRLDSPKQTLFVAISCLVLAYVLYFLFGRGVEFFPNVDPDFVQVQVQARGDLSIFEKDKLVKSVEEKLLNIKSVKSVYTRTVGLHQGGKELAEDVIGVIQLDFIDWQERPKATQIIADIRKKLNNLAGLKVQVLKQRKGPGQDKPVEVQLTSIDSRDLHQATETVLKTMSGLRGFKDVEDTRSLPGIEWRVNVDHEMAARYGADVKSLGDAVMLITNGLKLTEYQPDDADKELDIRLRLPYAKRSLAFLQRLRVNTVHGLVPIRHFVSIDMAHKNGTIQHRQLKRAVVIKADVEKGMLVDDMVKALKEALAKRSLPKDVGVHFKGESEDQKEAGHFLTKSFFIAIFLMSLVLLLQFNSFYQTLIVLSAIVLSTAGILIGLLMTQNPFGIVMCGLGVISLAGIVVNNNIVLIDTYNKLCESGLDTKEAILQTCERRMRPVLLTSVTTVLGLLPMVFALTVDIIGQEILFGAPSTEWWLQLSTSIAGGLTFATLLTLILTPCMLMLRPR